MKKLLNKMSKRDVDKDMRNIGIAAMVIGAVIVVTATKEIAKRGDK